MEGEGEEEKGVAVVEKMDELEMRQVRMGLGKRRNRMRQLVNYLDWGC